MAIHFARISLMQVLNNEVKHKNNMTLAEVARSSHEMRVIEDSRIPNTSGNPDISNYLELEEEDGFTLYEIDQTFIITYSLSDRQFSAFVDSDDASSGVVIRGNKSGQKIYVTSFILSSNAETWMRLRTGSGTSLTGKIYVAANGGASWTARPGEYIKVPTAENLELITGAAGDVSATVTGYQE